MSESIDRPLFRLGGVILAAALAVTALIVALQVFSPAPAAVAAPQVSGDLEVFQFSEADFFGAFPGREISFTIWAVWGGNSPAPNGRLVDSIPDVVDILSVDPAPSSQVGNNLTWNFGTMPAYFTQQITVTGQIKPDAETGIVYTNTATLSADVTDTDPSNNSASVGFEVKPVAVDLWVWKWGLMEETESGNYLSAEVDVPTNFEITYFNISWIPAPDVKIVDTLPAGLEFVSADPAPTSVVGNVLTWDVGTISMMDFGVIQLRARPTVLGEMKNEVTITSTLPIENPEWAKSSFSFDVVPLLMPRVLKPSGINQAYDKESPLIVGTAPQIEGLARAGATVTLYQGSDEGCWGDLADCNVVPVATAVAGPDRLWTMTPTLPTTGTVALYLQAEKDGEKSAPLWNDWSPFFILVDPLFEQSGFDFDNFVIEADDHEVRPGGIGGSSGTTPDAEFTITMRQQVPDSVASNSGLWGLHDLELHITDGTTDPYTETLKVKEMRKVTSSQASDAESQAVDGWEYEDLIYVHKGFGPGSKIEVWCRPVYYPDEYSDLPPIVGLVWVKCHEIVVDPAGYVYDTEKAGGDYDWPSVPPNEALLTKATVTVMKRVGDDTWEPWDAEETAQVNPQVTDSSTQDRILIPGYFAFYVPPGQYRVEATAEHCAPYTSPILTVIDAPVFHNVGMRCTAESQSGVGYPVFVPFLVKK